MNVFIVYAHHDPNSFANAMLSRALEVLKAEGHETRVSDLHAMKFKAVADDGDFTTPRPDVGPGQGTDYQTRQRVASRDLSYSPDILEEMEKLDWADAVIFLFPYYYFHFPSILKGWVDRVLVYDRYYSNDHPEIGDYGNGGLKGKRALLGISFGAPKPPHGAGPSRHFERLEAIQSGALNYVGLDAMAPFVAWSVAHVSHETRLGYLDEWAERVRNLFTEEPELRAADGATPPPELLTGRVRAPGGKAWPYGGDKTLAGMALVAKAVPLPGKSGELLEALKPFVNAAALERATRVYSILQPDDGSEEVWLIEAYDSVQAHLEHNQSTPFSQIGDAIGHLLAEPPTITKLVPKLAKGL